MDNESGFAEGAGLRFHLLRCLTLAVSCLAYVFVYFHRSCTSVLAADMALTYGVEKADLSIFSSIFFYPYGILQFFAGLLADVIQPAFLISGAQLLASIGAIVCGASSNLAVGCFGRVLVGLGCGPTYVPGTRMILNWFPAKYYANMIGILSAIGCCGGIIAARPLVSFSEAYTWRWGFYGIAIVSGICAILTMVFIRGHPNEKGYKGPNGEMQIENETTIRERFVQLWDNLKIVARRSDFWICVVYCLCGNAPLFSFTAMWAASFLKDAFHYTPDRASDTVMGVTVGIIAGAFIFAVISNALQTRKWVCFGVSAGAAVVCLVFTVVEPQQPVADVPSNAAVWVLLVIFGAMTISIGGIGYPLVREYYAPEQAGTAVGTTNSLSFLATAVYQEISTAAIRKYGKDLTDPAGLRYARDGYRYGVWLFYLVSFAVGAAAIAFAKDSEVFKVVGEGGPEEARESAKEEGGKADDGSPDVTP
jgi:sugar phosphate permease